MLHVVKQITTNIIAHKQNYDVRGATYQTTTWNQFVHTITFHVHAADKSDIMAKAEKPALCPTAIEMSTTNTCQLMTQQPIDGLFGFIFFRYSSTSRIDGLLRVHLLFLHYCRSVGYSTKTDALI